MTLKNRYDEVIKNIEVTEEMRDRILNNIGALNIEKKPKKTISLIQYKKYLSIAACFVFLFVGSIVIYHAVQLPSDPPIQAAPGIAVCDSAKKLSDAVGFTVKEIQKLPFGLKSVIYTSYWGELAEIEYTGLDNTATLRMSAGNKDVSGYYGEFTSIESRTVNGHDVTIKGDTDQYILAVWQNDGYSYSVQFIEPVLEQEMLDTIQSIK